MQRVQSSTVTKKTAPEPESKYDDSRRPLLATARSDAIVLAMVTTLSLLVWGGKNGMSGVWDVLLGADISGSFVLLTTLDILFTARTLPPVTLAAMLSGWLSKIVILIGVLVVVRDLEFHDSVTFFVTVVFMLMVALDAEVWGILQSNFTYVQPTKDE